MLRKPTDGADVYFSTSLLTIAYTIAFSFSSLSLLYFFFSAPAQTASAYIDYRKLTLILTEENAPLLMLCKRNTLSQTHLLSTYACLQNARVHFVSTISTLVLPHGTHHPRNFSSFRSNEQRTASKIRTSAYTNV